MQLLNMEQIKLFSTRIKVFLFLFPLFGFIQLWNIPHTIALRYLLGLMLFIIVIISKPDWIRFLKSSSFLVIFFAYLIFQLIFFSTDFNLAIHNFRAEWMEFILFSIVGAGTGLLIGKRGPKNILLYLGIAFSVPLYIHLILSIKKGIEISGIPWHYWGINEIHGDLGYTALQASIFLFVYFLYQTKSLLEKILVLGLISACIASPLLADSRGGTAFVLCSILFITAISLFSKNTKKIKLITIVCVALTIGATIKIGITFDPTRWEGVISRIEMGLKGDSTEIYCQGINSLRKELINEGVEITPQIQAKLNSIEDGDGARMLAARSGLKMIALNPMGINQSKQAYQSAISKACASPPKLFISHTHNGWIDTALSIGVPGALLLLAVMFAYAKKGFGSLRSNIQILPYSMALFTTSVIWIIRGLFDSTFRDQMLEMQGFTLALLLGILLVKQMNELAE